jgi:hypothetical protein
VKGSSQQIIAPKGQGGGFGEGVGLEVGIGIGVGELVPLEQAKIRRKTKRGARRFIKKPPARKRFI